MDEELEADETSLAIEENYSCKVLPVSQLTVDQEGIDSGDVDHFFVRLAVSSVSDTRPRGGWGVGRQTYDRAFTLLWVEEGVGITSGVATTGISPIYADRIGDEGVRGGGCTTL